MLTQVGMARCGSPLEVELVEALSRVGGFEPRGSEEHPWEVGQWPGWFLVLLAQPTYGPYRPDLSITSVILDNTGAPGFILLIEVDGHEFHEKTKAQVKRDKQRDRFMTTTGARVLRYSGSEVYADPDQCAEEIYECAISLQRPLLDQAFTEHLMACGT